MDVGDYCWNYRDHYRDPFPHSLLSTRETKLRFSRLWLCLAGDRFPGSGSHVNKP